MSQFRFHVSDESGLLETTEWQDELKPRDAPLVAEALRARYPAAQLRVERHPILERAKQKFVRFTLKEDNDQQRLSRLFPESEAERVLADIQQRYPKAEIERTVVEM